MCSQRNAIERDGEHKLGIIGSGMLPNMFSPMDPSCTPASRSVGRSVGRLVARSATCISEIELGVPNTQKKNRLTFVAALH